MSLTHCANCNSELLGAFCSNCGQSAKNRRGPIWQVTSEFAQDILSIDSKVLKSLGTLLFKPGVLSARFLEGKRASALPPVRLYLVISLIFFFVFQIPTPDVSNDNVYIDNILLGKEKPTEGQPKFSLVTFHVTENSSAFTVWIDSFIQDKKEVLRKNNAQATITELFNNLESTLPNILILFLPLFALLFKLLYYFKKVLYFDHLIFALHFQAWLMGMVLIIYALALQNPWWSALSVFIPIYLAKAQKVVYKQSYWLVMPKTIIIIMGYMLLLGMGAVTAFLSSMSQL